MPDNHDKRYKALFSHPELVRELLLTFVDEEFVHRLDFTKMEQVNRTFISRRHTRREADMIWKIPLDNEPVYLFLLMEFQSTVDRFMAIRMLRYILEFYEYLIKEGAVDYLPPVFPLLVYNGDMPWTASFDIQSLIRPGIEFDYLPRFRYYPIFEQSFPDDILEYFRNPVAAVFYLEKSHPNEMRQRLGKLRDFFDGTERAVVDQVRAFIDDYLRDHENFLENRSILEKTLPEEDGGMFSTALKGFIELEKKQAIEEGLAEGRAEGRAQGMLREQQSILIRQMERKFGPDDAMALRIEACQDPEKLDRALDAILDAVLAEDVLKLLS